MFTAIGELVQKDHPAVGHRRAAVAERHLDAAEDLSARHVSRKGEHADGQDVDPISFSRGGGVRGQASKLSRLGPGVWAGAGLTSS